MNTKDVMALIDRRYKKKINDIVDKYSALLKEEEDKKISLVEEINENILDYASKEFKKHNLEIKEDYKENCKISYYYIKDSESIKELRQQKDKEIKKLEKEKEDLLDSIIVKKRWVCIDYECWIGLGHKEPNANKCKYYDEEKQ